MYKLGGDKHSVSLTDISVMPSGSIIIVSTLQLTVSHCGVGSLGNVLSLER